MAKTRPTKRRHFHNWVVVGPRIIAFGNSKRREKCSRCGRTRWFRYGW